MYIYIYLRVLVIVMPLHSQQNLLKFRLYKKKSFWCTATLALYISLSFISGDEIIRDVSPLTTL